MIYVWDITENADSWLEKPHYTRLELCKGYIYLLNLWFPPGSNGLLHLHINRGLHQVWPETTGSVYRGGNTFYQFAEGYYLTEEPYLLKAYALNYDAKYSHTVTIQIGITRIE